jgi:hypothetical protein
MWTKRNQKIADQASFSSRLTLIRVQFTIPASLAIVGTGKSTDALAASS